MAQFTLDPEALAGKYEALREDVNGDRDVMHKRIATLEIFDDPDQFALIMSHYCLVFAASGACVPLVGACSGG